MIRATAILLFALVQSASAAPLDSSFVYQGQLQQAGAPAQGLYDFSFALYDELSAGVQVGSTLVVEDVPVSDGVFSVQLDFGSAAFDGEQRWLAIGVRDGLDAASFQALTPRQQVTATPYALYAERVAPSSVGSIEIIPQQVQRRATGTCAQGTVLIGINEDGSLNCAAFADHFADVEARIVALEDAYVDATCVAGGSVVIGGDMYNITVNGLQILGANPAISALGFNPFRVTVCDWTQDGVLLNIYQTGVAEGWNEEHALPIGTRTAATPTTPPFEEISNPLEHVDLPGDQVNGMTTLFNNVDNGSLTYVLRIYSPDDSLLADCIAWGHNVAAVFAGAATSNNPVTNPAEISPSNCADLSR